MFGREAPVVRREAPVLLPAVGGFQFGRRPNVVLAVGESFAHLSLGAKPVLPTVGGFQFDRRPKVLLAVGELFVRA